MSGPKEIDVTGMEGDAVQAMLAKEIAGMQACGHGARGGAQMAQIEQMMAAGTLNALQGMEKQMDEEIARLNELENLKDSELDLLRDRRRAAMQKQARQREEWRAKGHGEYVEIKGEKEFFAEVKGSERVIVHFFRSATLRCNIIDRHMSDAAKKHVETKFIKIDAEKSPFLVEQLHIWMMPSILLVQNTKTMHTITGFDEFGGTDDFSHDMFRYVLGGHGMINHDGIPPEDPEADRTHVDRFTKSSVRQKKNTLDDDDDWWD